MSKILQFGKKNNKLTHESRLEKRINFMKRNMTPEQKNEMDNMMMNCLSGIIESETGNKPIIEKEGESIKITTEEPTINWKKK